MTTKRTPLKYDLRSVFSESVSDDGGLEFFINNSRSNAQVSENDIDAVEPAKKVKWDTVLKRIEKKSNPQVFFWFSPLEAVTENEKKLVLRANNDFDRDWIENHYIDFISDTVKEIYGIDLEIQIIADENGSKKESKNSKNTSSQKDRKSDLFTGFISPNYTFDRFIVGPSNQFAHAASTAVARKPGEAYNPLFIYGGVGLGKTHLINAIGNEVLKLTSNMARVCCISAEHFTNQVINSIKSNKMEEFRNRYRFGCDVLLIDDIQFIAGKESTQEEFFHTFNTLYESKKQIVLTSDKSPKDMSYLEERLRSRFEWGLITDIQPPETETRIAIIKNIAENQGIVIPNDVGLYIAKNTTSNIRELEGTLTNMIAHAKLLNAEISIDLAKDVLKNIIKHQEKKFVTIESIQREVANYYAIRIQDLKSDRKQKNIAVPRQVCMYLARKYTGASYPEIGEKFGGKDHSTVIHAVKKIEKLLGNDLSLTKTVESISKKIESLMS